jgi:hypothetical protein
MPNMLSASQEAQAITTAVDLFFLTVATDKPIILHGLELCQTTDLGDANEEVLRIGLYRGVTGGGGGSALTEVALEAVADIPTAATAVVGQGTASTAGSLMGVIGWNIRQTGPTWLPTPELRPRISAANDPIAFRLLAAPTDSITISGTVYWEEP